MSEWTLAIHPAAAAELAAIPERAFARVEKALLRLTEDPFRPRPGADIRKLKDCRGGNGLYRLRVGEWRVVYAVISAEREVGVLGVEVRELGYARLMAMAERRLA